MSDIWQFCKSSEPLVKKLLESAVYKENKWTRAFGRRNFYGETKKVEEEKPAEVEEPVPEVKKPAKILPEVSDDFIEILETEPIARFDYFVSKVLENKEILVPLATKLSRNTIEKIADHTLKNDLSETFLNYFYEIFYPAFVKHEFSWFGLDILMKASKVHRLKFRGLLKTLLQDTEVPSKVLQDIVTTFDSDDKTDFLKILDEVPLTSEEFVHNIFSIHVAYKDSNKDERIQKFLLTYILKHSHHCLEDRHFGRLVLTFLQTQKLLGLPLNFDKMERLLDFHRTPFKRPCMTLLNEINEKSQRRNY